MVDAIKLAKDQKKKIQEWLEEKWTAPPGCPVCQTTNFTIADHLVTPTILADGGMMLGGPSYPQALLICDNCGHTRYFNVLRMDILPKKTEKKEGQDDGE